MKKNTQTDSGSSLKEVFYPSNKYEFYDSLLKKINSDLEDNDNKISDAVISYYQKLNDNDFLVLNPLLDRVLKCEKSTLWAVLPSVAWLVLQLAQLNDMLPPSADIFLYALLPLIVFTSLLIIYHNRQTQTENLHLQKKEIKDHPENLLRLTCLARKYEGYLKYQLSPANSKWKHRVILAICLLSVFGACALLIENSSIDDQSTYGWLERHIELLISAGLATAVYIQGLIELRKIRFKHGPEILNQRTIIIHRNRIMLIALALLAWLYIGYSELKILIGYNDTVNLTLILVPTSFFFMVRFAIKIKMAHDENIELKAAENNNASEVNNFDKSS